MLGVEPSPISAGPTLVFTLRASEPSGIEIYTIALAAEIQIDPARRVYDAETRERLTDLFGSPDRWAQTTQQSVLWTRADVLVPSFVGETDFEVPILCNYDLELAATKYFYSLPDHHAPLSFYFTGTVFYRGDDGRMQLVKVPWSASARFRLPVDVWRQMIDGHYASSAWIRLHSDTLARLVELKTRRGLPTFDACVAELVEGVEP